MSLENTKFISKPFYPNVDYLAIGYSTYIHYDGDVLKVVGRGSTTLKDGPQKYY